MLSSRLFTSLLLCAAGALAVFSFAPFNYNFIIAASILFLLFIIESNNNLKILSIYGAVYGLSWFSVQLYWIFYCLYSIIKVGFIVSLIGYLLFVFYLSFYIFLSIVVYHSLKTKSHTINLLFIFPSVWVICEWIRGFLFSGFSWCDVSYSEVNNIFIRGFFPLLGSYGVSWITLSLFGALFIVILSIFSKKIIIGSYSAIIYILIILSIGINLNYINYTKNYNNKISVALIQGNVSTIDKWSNVLHSLELYKEDIKKTKADIVITPETAIPVFDSVLPKGYLQDLESIAKQNNSNLIVGIPKIIDKEGNYINSALVVTSPTLSYYAKYHLVPYGEYIPFKYFLSKIYKFANLPMVDFTAGALNPLPLTVGLEKIAFNICYENGFNREIYIPASKSSLMVNLSDLIWYGTSIAKDQHLQLSQARAIENQRYFIQVTNTGITAIIKPNGEIQSKLMPFQHNILFDFVQGRVGRTPYEIYGNYLIITICFIILILCFLKREL